MSGATREDAGAASDLLSGLWAVPRALGLILRSRKLVAWAAVPVLMTAVLLTVLIVLANWALSGWLGGLVGAGESWWQLVSYYVVMVVVLAATVVVAYFVFSAVGLVVASPFNDVLSDRAERICRATDDGGARESPAEGSAAGDTVFAGVVRSVSEACRHAAAMLAIQAALLPLLLVPIAGAAINIVAASYLNGADFLDMVLSRHGFTYAEKKAVIRASRARALGLGAGLALTMLFPLTTLLVLPVGVVGGTLVCLDLEREGRLASATFRSEERGE